LRHHDARAFTWARDDLEFVHQASGPAQTQAQTTSGGEAVRHGLLDVGNARPMVFECQAKPSPGPVNTGLKPDASTAAMSDVDPARWQQ